MTDADLQISGPVTFVNGMPSSPAAQKLASLGYNPASGGGYGPFLQGLRQQMQTQQAAPQQPAAPAAPTPGPIASAVPPPQPATPAAPAPAAQAPAPQLPPPALSMTGPIQQALGVPMTTELANQYRYNPPWRS